MARRLLLLAALTAAVGWYWVRWKPAHDYRSVCVKLESAVAAQLAAVRLSDRDVLLTRHQEHSRWNGQWVESERRIQVDVRRVPTVFDRLAGQAKKLGCDVLQRQQSPDAAVLVLGKKSLVFQRIELVPPVYQPPEVALVIDDVAYDVSIMDDFAALGVPLTFAILPRDKHSKALAERAGVLNFPVILHLPMEPLDMKHNNPGPAALYLKMNEKELRAQFEKNVASVPTIQGINNHMGSAFTSNVEKMRWVLEWVKEKNLFFMDSNTSPHSVVMKTAKEVGVPCLLNETFLDNEDDMKYIEKQLDIVLKLALQRKRTIAIGHYRRKHLVAALAEKLPEFKARGIQLVGLPAFYPKHP